MQRNSIQCIPIKMLANARNVYCSALVSGCWSGIFFCSLFLSRFFSARSFVTRWSRFEFSSNLFLDFTPLYDDGSAPMRVAGNDGIGDGSKKIWQDQDNRYFVEMLCLLAKCDRPFDHWDNCNGPWPYSYPLYVSNRMRHIMGCEKFHWRH